MSPENVGGESLAQQFYQERGWIILNTNHQYKAGDVVGAPFRQDFMNEYVWTVQGPAAIGEYLEQVHYLTGEAPAELYGFFFKIVALD